MALLSPKELERVGSISSKHLEAGSSACMAEVQATGWEHRSWFFVGTISKLSAISLGYLPLGLLGRSDHAVIVAQPSSL